MTMSAEDSLSDSESDVDFCPEEEIGNSQSEDSSIEDSKTKDVGGTNTRNTRSKPDHSYKKNVQTDKLENVNDKSRTDALYKDFLNDVDLKPIKEGNTSLNSMTNSEKTDKIGKDVLHGHLSIEHKLNDVTKNTQKSNEFSSKCIKVHENDEKKLNMSNAVSFGKSHIQNDAPIGRKRTSAGSNSALGSVLNQIGKKKKLSVLEKSKMDWNEFKTDEGISEELETHNKGKGGYLQRQDFLQRTDFKQFEIEKSLRDTRRKN